MIIFTSHEGPFTPLTKTAQLFCVYRTYDRNEMKQYNRTREDKTGGFLFMRGLMSIAVLLLSLGQLDPDVGWSLLSTFPLLNYTALTISIASLMASYFFLLKLHRVNFRCTLLVPTVSSSQTVQTRILSCCAREWNTK